MQSSVIHQWHTALNKLGFFACIMLGFWSSVAVAGGAISMSAVLICFLLSGDWHKKSQLLRHPLVWAALILFVWIMIGVLYSAGNWPHSLRIALKYDKLLLIGCVIYFIGESQCRFYWMLAGLIAGVFLNLLAIYLNYFFLPQNSAIAFVRASWPSAQGHGQFALFTLIFSFSFLAAATSLKLPKKWRYALLIIGLLALIAEIFLNSSRTGYVMEFVVLALLLLQARKLSIFIGLIMAIVLLFGAAYYFSPIFKNRINVATDDFSSYTKGESNTTSVGLRLNWYQTSAEILLQNPSRLIFGYGSGSYRTVSKDYYAQLQDKNPNFEYQSFPNPHNQYILLLFENGILGLCWLFAFLYIVWHYGKSLPYLWRCTIWVTLIGMTVNMLFNAALMDFSPSIVFISVIAFLSSHPARKCLPDARNT